MKTKCTYCGNEAHLQEPTPRFCCQCGEVLPPTGSNEAWHPLARFLSVADAGYHADILTAEGIHCRVVHQSDFDETRSGWQQRFVLMVPESQVQSATESLKMHLDADEEVDGFSGIPATQSEKRPVIAKAWPLVATTLIGAVFGAAITSQPENRSAVTEAGQNIDEAGGAQPKQPVKKETASVKADAEEVREMTKGH